MKEIMWDIAHLAHVELLTPKLDESTRFFTEIMGMSISDIQGNSVYLRAYDDYEHHTLKLTAHRHAGIGHHAWRLRSPDLLEEKAESLKKQALASVLVRGTWVMEKPTNSVCQVVI